LQIVFEIASCPWKDGFDHECDGDKTSYGLHASSGVELFRGDVVDQCDIMLRCMILRKKYGGMTCDKEMIDGFVSLWCNRYRSSKVEPDVVTRCFPASTKEVIWKEVPDLMHSFNNVLAVLGPLLNSQLPSLTMHDISPSGIDFHCSNVIDMLVRDTSFSSKLYILLGPSASNAKDEVMKILKTMMWDYSSGVNHRRAFDHRKNESVKTLGTNFKAFWEEEAQPLVNTFTSAYISARLAK